MTLEGIGEALLAPPQAADLPEVDLAPLLARLDEIERSRSVWEAEMEAQLLKADSKYKAARNAEERAKTHARGPDEVDEVGVASEDEVREIYRQMGWVPAGDVNGGDVEGMLGLRPGVEVPSLKSQAVRAKFGV